jgi:hypothetical protein
MRAHGREGRQKSMRAGKFLAMLAIAALAIGAFSAAAVAGKKKRTVPVFLTGYPKFSTGGEVTAKGKLDATVTRCQPQRQVRLQVLDANGEVLATIDEGHTPDKGGSWKLSGHLPTNLPAGTNSVGVKAKKGTAGEFVCQAGVSIAVPIP